MQGTETLHGDPRMFRLKSWRGWLAIQKFHEKIHTKFGKEKGTYQHYKTEGIDETKKSICEYFDFSIANSTNGDIRNIYILYCIDLLNINS